MKDKRFLISWKRFVLIAIALLFIFTLLMVFLYLKADEITRDPCSICAEYMGEEVTCYSKDFYLITRTYSPNETITESR